MFRKLLIRNLILIYVSQFVLAAIPTQELVVTPSKLIQIQEFKKTELSHPNFSTLDLQNLRIIPHSVFRSKDLLSMSYYVDLKYYKNFFSQGSLKIQGEIIFEYKTSTTKVRVTRTNAENNLIQLSNNIGINQQPEENQVEQQITAKLDSFLKTRSNFDKIMQAVQQVE